MKSVAVLTVICAFASSVVLANKDQETDTAVVSRITGFKPPRNNRLPGFRRTKPTRIDSKETLAKVFGQEDAGKINQQVDFDKQGLVFFQWAGSGEDKLAYMVQKQDGKTKLIFTFKPGRTRDLRPHWHLFSIRKGVEWEVAK